LPSGDIAARRSASPIALEAVLAKGSGPAELGLDEVGLTGKA
jgi:hypothetical protein